MRALAVLFLMLPASLFSQYPETIYDMKDGLPHNIVVHIQKDREGFLWLATTNGLCRFDGYGFQEYSIEDPNNGYGYTAYQHYLSEANQAHNFIGNSSHIYNFDPAKDSLISCVKSEVAILCLVDDMEGNTWIPVWQGLVKIDKNDPGKVNGIEYPIVGGPDRISGLLPQSDSTFLAFTNEGMIRLVPEDLQFNVEQVKVILDGQLTSDLFASYPTFFLFGDKVLVSSRLGLFETGLKYLESPFTDSILYLDESDLHEKYSDKPGTAGIFYKFLNGGRGRIIFRTDRGIFSYEEPSGDIELIKAENYGLMDSGEGIYQMAMYYDNEVLWAGTDLGLMKIVLPNKSFRRIVPEPGQPGRLNATKLNQAVVDYKGDLWVGSISHGLYHSIADRDGRFTRFENFRPSDEDTLSLHHLVVSKILEDKKNRLWVGNYSLQQKVEIKGHTVFITSPISRYAKLISPYEICVTCLAEGPEGNIILATLDNQKMCWLYRPEGNRAYFAFLDSMNNFIQDPWFFSTRDNTLYMYCLNSIYRLREGWKFNEVETIPRVDDPDFAERFMNWTLVPRAYPLNPEKLLVYPGDTLYRARFIVTEFGEHSELWFVETDNSKKIRRYRLTDLENFQANDLSADPPEPLLSPGNDKNLGYIYELIEDLSGNVWISTNDGLVKIDPETNEAVTFYEEDGISDNNMYWGISMDRQGRIFACTTNGLFYFYPDNIRPDPPPEVKLTQFRMFHKPVRAGKGSVLRSSIACTEGLKLKHKQNYLGFSFTALDFRQTDRVRYRYRMEGLDKDWIDADDRRLVDYLNMRPGRYTFRVIAANGNGVWNRKGTSLAIRILPPFWLRWWAIALESMLLLGSLIAIIRFRERNLKQRASMLEQQVEEKTHEILAQRKEVDELKSRFYANISHEFRTPLTLIVGPLEDSLKAPDQKISFEKRLARSMLRNARRLQHLINQLLDISKLESGSMQLQLVRAKLPEFVRTIANSFLSLAESNHIGFTIEARDTGSDACFDPDKVEMILTNLLSNAFKFTKEGGEVGLSLHIEKDPDSGYEIAEIRVTDTGIGMEQEQLLKIFDRFYQVSSSDTREVEGSGIGLALTKEMVELMHGSIEVQSEPGKGTRFLVMLPVSMECYPEGSLSELEYVDKAYAETPAEDLQPEAEEEENLQDTPEKVLLVVEDNPDLRRYISDQFSGEFAVVEAKNGKTGLEKAKKHLPDLVISDLMMPVMGGMEMTEKIKTDPATNHIPVIMLTARADRESRLEGLETGADDYVIKPFDAEELTIRVKNLICQREILRDSFEKNYLLGEYKDGASSQYKLLREIMKVMDKYLGDPELDLVFLANELNVSRSQFFRKVRSITGTTPNELLRMIRMKRAAHLLRSSDLNVTQVMYQVGLKNPSHFSNSFKKYFSVNPGEYRGNGNHK